MFNWLTKFKEKHVTKLIVKKDAKEIGADIAQVFIKKIKEKPDSVFALATGSSPLETYNHLIKAYDEKQVSFAKIRTFNFDEYVRIPKKYENQSYANFMNDNLFKHIDVNRKNIHFPSAAQPKIFDKKIKETGGIDIAILGIGSNGHIAFNEPGSSFFSKTRIVILKKSTIKDNARFFDCQENNVPKKAVTMGISTILKAKKIVLVATGKNKARAVSKIFSKHFDPKWPCTALMFHPDVTVYVDSSAAMEIQ